MQIVVSLSRLAKVAGSALKTAVEAFTERLHLSAGAQSFT
jgi:hypothetical protein